MARPKALNILLGTLSFVAGVAMCLIFVVSRITEERVALDQKFIQEVLEKEEAKHQRVVQARENIPGNLRLPRDWSLEQAMTAWNTDEMEEISGLAKQFSESYRFSTKGKLSAEAKEELRDFAMHSPELDQLLEAIEHGLCEISIDPEKGPWQVSTAQVHALHAMFYLLSARALLFAEAGDKENALETVLSGYGLLDALLDTPSVHIQHYRSSFLSSLKNALRDGLRPGEIPDSSKATLLAYLDRQTAKEPLVNALLLHEALARREVAGRLEDYPNFLISWDLAGYHAGIQRMVQFLDSPHGDGVEASRAIAGGAPFYAGSTGWRLQNVAGLLVTQGNVQRGVSSLRAFLEME